MYCVQRLDASQLSCLLRHTSSRVPLWLSIALEELRVFGDFATVSEKIASFPEGLNDLAKHVLDRLLREDESQCVEKVESLLSHTLCRSNTTLLRLLIMTHSLRWYVVPACAKDAHAV